MGFGHLASTTLNEAGFDGDIIEAALAHVDTNTVRAAYNRAQYIERRKVMMDWWSERIENAALTGEMTPVIFGNIHKYLSLSVLVMSLEEIYVFKVQVFFDSSEAAFYLSGYLTIIVQ